MVELEGKSGVRHTFSEANVSAAFGSPEDGDLIVRSVADVLDSVATITEVLALYAKALDVGAREVSLEAPSFDEKAEKIAAEYGVRLRKK
jgi:hypothetical protein